MTPVTPVTVAVLLLTACARPMPDEGLTTPPPSPSPSPSVATERLILDRKAQTQAVERQIADGIPGETDARQSTNGALFTCTGGDRQWVVGADVAIEGPADMASIVDVLLQRWDGRDGYAVERESDAAGLPTADIVGADGEGYLVARGTTADEVTIILSSRCFPVPDGFSGAGSW